MKIADNTLSDGTPWRVFTPDNASSEWIVLWLQGFKSTIDGDHTVHCSRMSQRAGVTFVMLDYAGHGRHPVRLRDATRKQQFEQASKVYDELINLGYTKVIIMGNSFGGYIAALLSSKKNPITVVLSAPANHKDEEFILPYDQTDSGKKSREYYHSRQSIDEDYSNSATESLKNFGGQTYIIEYEKDSVINSAIPQLYYSVAQHGNYIVVPGLDHSPKMMDEPDRYFEIVEEWLNTILCNTFKHI